MPELSPAELNRYSRHTNLPQVGLEGQLKLKRAKVLVVGAGGLGSPALLYLAAAGIGFLGIADYDRVDESNLQRQTLFGMADIGRPKAEAAAERLRSLNPYIHIETHPQKLDSGNALDIFSRYDLVIDGSDNFPTRYLVNDACVLAGLPCVYGSISQFEGQVSVFNLAYPDGRRSPNYRDWFPEPPAPGSVPSCSEGGVIGVLPGIIGCMQANEAIKIIAGIGKPLAGSLFVYNSLDCSSNIFRLSDFSSTQGSITQLIDYEIFCGLKNLDIREITPAEYREMKEKTGFFLVDVRETNEYEAENLGGLSAPLSELEKHIHKIPKHIEVLVHCKAGGRSAKAIRFLQAEYGFSRLINLKGGMEGVKSEK